MLCLMGGIATGCAMGSMAADASSSLVEGLFASSQKAATPEEAIEQFFAALKMQNIEAMRGSHRVPTLQGFDGL